MQTFLLIGIALLLGALLHLLIGVVQRKLAKRLEASENVVAEGRIPLNRLLFDWGCNALRTVVWILFFMLVVNLVPETKAEVDNFGDRLLNLRRKVVDALLNRGVNLVIVLVTTVFTMRFAAALIRATFLLVERGTANREEIAVGRRLQTLSSIFRGAAQTVIFFIGLMFFLQSLGTNITPILASAGVVGIAVGFGAQSLIRDLFGGLLILLEDQFSVGDSVKIGEVSGTVERLTLRATSLRAQDGALTTIPNGSISVVSNFSKDWSRTVLDIEIDYDEDIERAMRVIVDTAQKLYQDDPRLIIEEPVMQGVDRLSHSAITLRLVAKTAPNKQNEVARELRRRLRLAFEKEGIRTPNSRQQFVLVNQGKPVA
jgi:small conductance mechanosensitive channel